MELQVVVNVKCLVQEHSTDKVIAVRFPPLGLTAYGDTEDEAVRNFKRLFNRFVRTYREAERLEDVLNRSGVEWWWLDKYPADRPPFEDTHAVSLQQQPELRIAYQQAWQVVSENQDAPARDFAVAA